MKSKSQWLFETPFTPEANPLANQGYYSNPELEFTPNPVIDPRIDVSAQRALMTMLNSNPTDRAIALRAISSVRTGRVTGLYQEDQRVPALLARRMNTWWWLLLGGTNAAMFCDPTNLSSLIPPLTFVFRRNLDRQILIQEIRSEFGKPRLTGVC